MKTLGIFSGQSKYAAGLPLKSRIVLAASNSLAGGLQSCMIIGLASDLLNFVGWKKQAALWNQNR
jgi:hypothetical protein